MDKEENWFSDWFNTKYYHILYQNRNDKEAEVFISNIIDFLAIEKNSLVLDAACGAGRHSRMVNNLGYSVIGMDLSAESIKTAKEFENDSLQFSVADLREFKMENKFKLILNLFTSFGYFSRKSDNLKILENFRNSLTTNGFLVLDFMNAFKISKELVLAETKILNNITFEISRKIDNGVIVKEIVFNDEKGLKREYQERVSAFELEDFKELFSLAGFQISHIFGNYFLDEFIKEESPRLLLVAKPI